MLLLDCLIFLMLLIAILLLFIPKLIHKNLATRYFIFTSFFLVICSLSLYFFTSRPAGLRYWLTEGQSHYQLQQQIKSLGGLTGMIQRIKIKLQENPNDAKGWFILGKLYLANQQHEQAKKAFEKSLTLNPNDPTIKQFYELQS